MFETFTIQICFSFFYLKVFLESVLLGGKSQVVVFFSNQMYISLLGEKKQKKTLLRLCFKRVKSSVL